MAQRVISGSSVAHAGFDVGGRRMVPAKNALPVAELCVIRSDDSGSTDGAGWATAVILRTHQTEIRSPGYEFGKLPKTT